MARKIKKGFLPRIEIIIVLVFFLSFIIWAMSKCSAKQSLYEQLASEDTESAEVETPAAATTLPPLPPNPDRPTSEANSQTSTPNTTTSAAPSVKTVYSTKLFVTIDGLKFRRGPSMDSAVIMTLPLYQEVEFMNEVSDSTLTVSLANGELVTERWIKVRHWKGHEGWVYGAGVNYFKPSNN